MENSGEINHSISEGVSQSSEYKLTPEELSRTDQDIHSIVALKELANKHSTHSVISGGYAVEAHCGGVITRPHRDMDVHWHSNNDLSQNLLEEVQEILQRDNPEWKVQEKKPGKKYQFDEVIDPDKKGRRLELSIDKPLIKKSEIKTLIDSKGNEFEVLVPPLSEVIAKKVIIFSIKNAMTPDEKAVDKRPTKLQDIKDFQRLLALSDFNQEECLRFLEGYMKYRKKQEGESLSSDHTLILAREEWNKTLDYINKFESTS